MACRARGGGSRGDQDIRTTPESFIVGIGASGAPAGRCRDRLRHPGRARLVQRLALGPGRVRSTATSSSAPRHRPAAAAAAAVPVSAAAGQLGRCVRRRRQPLAPVAAGGGGGGRWRWRQRQAEGGGSAGGSSARTDPTPTLGHARRQPLRALAAAPTEDPRPGHAVEPIPGSRHEGTQRAASTTARTRTTCRRQRNRGSDHRRLDHGRRHGHGDGTATARRAQVRHRLRRGCRAVR